MSTPLFFQPVYKVEFWDSTQSNLRCGFGIGYGSGVDSWQIKYGLTSTIGSFEVTAPDTGSYSGGYANGAAFPTVDTFDIVKIWFGYTGSPSLTGLSVLPQFIGRVETKSVDFAENGIMRTWMGRDLGECLFRILERRAYTGSCSNTIKQVRIDAGLSSSDDNITQDNAMYFVSFENQPCFNALKNVADFNDKDFYIDTGSELHWFTRHTISGSDSFEEGLNIISYRLHKDLNTVKNDWYIFGFRDPSVFSGSDIPQNHDLFTEMSDDFKLYSWTTPPGWFGYRIHGNTMVGGPGGAQGDTFRGHIDNATVDMTGSCGYGYKWTTPNIVVVGTGSVFNFTSWGLYPTSDTYAEMHAQLDLSIVLPYNNNTPGATYLMFNQGDTLNVYLAGSMSNMDWGLPSGVKGGLFIRLITNTGSALTGSDYFECALPQQGGNPVTGYSTSTDWWGYNGGANPFPGSSGDSLSTHHYSIPLGAGVESQSWTGSYYLKEMTTYRWTRWGNPDWYNIKYVDFFIRAKNDGNGIDGFGIFVDQLYFATRWQTHVTGSSSIATYGLRTNVLNDTAINDPIYIKNYANTQLAMYQDPWLEIEVETITKPFIIGTMNGVVINSENVNGQYCITDVEHNWKGGKLTSKILLTNQPQKRVPSALTAWPAGPLYLSTAKFLDQLRRNPILTILTGQWLTGAQQTT